MGVTNNIVQKLVEQARVKRDPITVNIELLPVCNLDCKMCYIRSDMEKTRKAGGLIPKESWINLAKELLDNNVFFLLLTGGEVFLYPEFQSLYEELCSMGFAITINTNATLVDEKIVDWLKKFPPKCVSISLYGASNETYEKLCGKQGMFTRVDKAIVLLQRAGIAIECKTLFTPLNVQDMKKCWHYCAKHKVPYEMTTYAYPPTRRLEDYEQIRFSYNEAFKYQLACNVLMYGEKTCNRRMVDSFLKYQNTKDDSGYQQYGFSCSASNSSCWISWQGHMTPCAMINEPYVLPFEIGFANAWKELKIRSDKIKMSSKCSYCAKRSICTTCPASNYAESGSLQGHSEYHCKMTDMKLTYLMKHVKDNNILKNEVDK